MYMNDFAANVNRQKLVTYGFLVPFILITSLFFLWGFAHSLLDVLNKHFQEITGITKARSGWVQASFYGGYAVMAVHAGLIMNRFGYKRVQESDGYTVIGSFDNSSRREEL
jgi:MFS transporter, FHS family, L-fucose permease